MAYVQNGSYLKMFSGRYSKHCKNQQKNHMAWEKIVMQERHTWVDQVQYSTKEVCKEANYGMFHEPFLSFQLEIAYF